MNTSSLVRRQSHRGCSPAAAITSLPKLILRTRSLISGRSVTYHSGLVSGRKVSRLARPSLHYRQAQYGIVNIPPLTLHKQKLKRGQQMRKDPYVQCIACDLALLKP
jgi:hypothetical protein